MDLKIPDVAEMLGVHPTTIRRWVKTDTIPHYKIESQYRFNRNEIENWVMHKKADLQKEIPPEEISYKVGGMKQYSLYRALHNGTLLFPSASSDKELIIKECVHSIAQPLSLDPEFLTTLFIERERLFPTALANGVALPHTRDFLLSNHQDIVTVAFLKEPIEFGSLDGKKVHTLFFLFACSDKRHLHLLAKIAHFCGQKENISFLESKPTKHQFLQFVKEWEQSLLYN